MKKISIFIIFLTGCIWLSACGNGIVSVGNTEISEETMKNAYYDLAKKQCDNKKYVSAINTIDLECNGYDSEGIRERAKMK